MQLLTLGGLRLTETSFGRVKPLLLLAYVTLEGARDRRHLAELFWPDAEDPLNSLSAALKQLRQGAPEVVEADQWQVASRVMCDAQTLLSASEAGKLGEALALYRGPFLHGIYLPGWGSELEEWVYSTREFIGSRVRGARLNLAEREAAAGRFDLGAAHAAAAYHVVGAAEPEPSEVERIHTLLAAGAHLETSAVRREAESYGVQLAALNVQEAKRRLRPAPTPSHNLPKRSTSFVGRELERAHLKDLLATSSVRLLSLVGPAGVGKTCLALHVAREGLEKSFETFPGGVTFVALSALASPQLIPATIAQALSLPQQGDTDSLSQVAQHLGDAPTLLLLDNFEHLMEGTLIVEDLLKRCPNLQLMVTTREPLNLEEEVVVRLDGLSYPALGDVLGAARLEVYDAPQLFLERARRVLPGFSPKDEEVPHLLAICRAVGGLPLGLELAAAWVGVLTCAEITQEIHTNLDFLAARTRNAPERHRSIRSAFTHSWTLLHPTERAVYRRLAVFRGGFTREAATRVSGATIPVLASLLDKSLLHLDTGGRYGCHPLLYSFAREHLEANAEEYSEVSRSHLNYFLALVEEAETNLKGPEQPAWLARLELEHENLRTALTWCEARAEVALTLRLVGGLSWFWYARGHLDEGSAWLRRILTNGAPGAPTESAARAKALDGAGLIAWSQNDYVAARSYQEESLALRRSLGDDRGTAASLNNLGIIAHDECNYALARTLHEESRALQRELRNLRGVALSTINLGLAVHQQGDRAGARALYTEGMALMRELNDQAGVALALNNLATVVLDEGDAETARPLLEEGLTLFWTLGDRRGVAFTLEGLASAALATEQWDRAAQLWAAATTLRQAIGAPLPPNERPRRTEEVTAATTYLGASAFGAAWTRGARLSTADAVAYALQTASSAKAC